MVKKPAGFGWFSKGTLYNSLRGIHKPRVQTCWWVLGCSCKPASRAGLWDLNRSSTGPTNCVRSVVDMPIGAWNSRVHFPANSQKLLLDVEFAIEALLPRAPFPAGIALSNTNGFELSLLRLGWPKPVSAPAALLLPAPLCTAFHS